MEIVIGSPRVSDNTIHFELHVPRPLRKYFLEDASYVQYDGSIDLRNVDGSILAIPMAGMVAPIAWAVGADVRMDEIDATYPQYLAKVRDAMRSFYPNFSFSGEVRAERTVSNRFGGGRTGILFSGGVDSMTSYVRHKDEKPDLISVWGLREIPPFENKYWSRMWTDICTLASHEGLRALQVKTDMFRSINSELLSKEFGLGWFSDVAVASCLLGLCAPITATRGIGTVIIASTYTEDFKGPPGSFPSVDGNVSWAGIRAVQDGYELSRQQKLRYLCRPENARYLSHLRVCWDNAFDTNCGTCEKCMRTIAGLAVEGVDPNGCNFAIDESTFPRMRDCLREGRRALDEGILFMWKDIQKHIPETIDVDLNGSREFLAWLKAFDLSGYRVNRLRRFLWELRCLLRNRRTKAPSIKRKMKSQCYITLARLRLL